MAFLLAQLVLVESGFACEMPEMMTDMSPVAMSMPASPEPASPEPANAPCSFPWAPAGCQSMAPCGPAALPAALQTVALPDTDSLSVPAGALMSASAVALAPAVPPPKA